MQEGAPSARSRRLILPGLTTCITLLLSVASPALAGGASDRISVLFLGDQGHHRPSERVRDIDGVLARKGIDVTYTEDMGVLTPETLGKYRGLMIFANTTEISVAGEKALLDYVAGGGGLIPVHCATYCFLNSPRYIELVGGQFQRHETGVFRTTIAAPDHPIMKGFGGFQSWDETYVHHLHNEKDRLVLSYRVEGDHREPYTWVRTHGKGRVFYTAWGHDQRTWRNPGFQNLLERGIRWAVGDDPAKAGVYMDDREFHAPKMTTLRTDVKPFTFVPAKVPNYLEGQQWGAQGDLIKEMQEPLSPDESMKHMVVPEGFHVELFAAEPDIGGKPMCMSWDENGRLWVGETYDYPNELQPPGEGRDRIRVCEDTDGDYRADKFTVFKEKLSIPSSVLPYRGGVIVHAQRQTLFLKDTDGDGKADEERVIFTGWNMGDTHGGASNLQYGLDNWIWGMQGYNRSTIEAGGETQRFSQGFYRFLPDGSKFEFLRSTNNNTWGMGFSEEGIVFGSTANRNPSVYMPIPNRYYEAVRGWSSSVLGTIADTHLFKPITKKIRQVDQFGGYTAGAGHALYTARHYPQDYWNRTAFINGPTGHLTGTFVIRRDGSDFKSTSPSNLLASDDEWTAPIMAEVGPDGNVWVIDWYNFIVQHNPTPNGFQTGRGAAYETELRDKKHGRILRIVYDGAKTPAPTRLGGASAETLVATLRNDNMLWRKQAQRLLVERGKKDVVAALVALVKDASVDSIGLNVGVIHALWTLHGLGALDGGDAAALAAATEALRHPSAGVRRNAIQVLPSTASSVRAILAADLTADEDAQVRLAALLALADLPPSEAAGKAVAMALLDPRHEGDRWIADAATSAGAHQGDFFLTAACAVEEPPAALIEALSRAATHFARGAPTEALGTLLAGLRTASAPSASTIVESLASSWPADRPAKLSASDEAALAVIFNRVTTEARGRMLKLAAAWGSEALSKYSEQIRRELSATLQDEAQPESARSRAAVELLGLQPNSSEQLHRILDLVTPSVSPALAEGLIEACQVCQAPDLVSSLLERFPKLSPSAQAVVVRVLLGRNDRAQQLLEACEKGEFQIMDLPLDQRQSLATHPDRNVAQRAQELLSKAGSLPDPDRQMVLEKVLPLASRKGDAELGKAVFEKQCSRCHRHGSLGNMIGPELTGMAVHPKAELLTQIIDPSRNVEGNYRVYTLVKSDGGVLSGLLASETRTTLEIIDSDGKTSTVERADLLELNRSNKSLMPDGFEKQMPEADLVNLLEFLTARGKYTPVSIERVATAVTTKGLFTHEDAEVERLIFPDWTPKTFDGVPFILIDPKGARKPNAILLYGPQGYLPPKMPRSVRVSAEGSIKALHLLSGVSGWGFPAAPKDSVSMIVRFHFEDGSTEDHPLKNGEHFSDYIRVVDVPQSKLAFRLRGRQIRYLSVPVEGSGSLKEIEFIKGQDATSPIVMAATVESR